jgi:hypothetical protein
VLFRSPKGTEKRTAENEHQSFSFEDNPVGIPNKIPEWIVDIIKASDEWQEIQHGGGSKKDSWEEGTVEDPEESIPF